MARVLAHFDTTLGKFTAELYEDKTPVTVGNFAGLAEGSKEWTHPKTKQKSTAPYYDGIIFHRVIEGFVIQGGDPLGLGYGGPGYNFADEFNQKLKHRGVGVLSMANAGPNTNGSQFFVLHKDYPLPATYSIFGRVTKGIEVIDALAEVPVRRGADPIPSEPLTAPVIKKITIRQ